jgi:hypothetical protein
MNRWTLLVAEVVMFLVIAVVGFGQAVHYLWNWLMPDLFGLRAITFWQAVGLMGLSWILFHAGFLGRSARRWSELGGRGGSGLDDEERARLRGAVTVR